MGKYVFNFGEGRSDGNAEMRDILGGKGANLAEMCDIGLPVPPGFTISTDVCSYFYDNQYKYPESLVHEIDKAIILLEKRTNKNFGSDNNPLLLSIRSGSRASMPGMMDTILNLGLNDKATKGLSLLTNNERFAFDCYRRFIQMYSNVVLDVDHGLFEDALEDIKIEFGLELDTDLEAQHLKKLVKIFKEIVKNETSKPFPQNPKIQIWKAIGAVFSSWMNNRAVTYRKLNNIPTEWGTAVNIQSMVFGNMGNDCATGVAFTRNPNTGKNIFYGEYLINAQGEDVVAGIRTPQPLTAKDDDNKNVSQSMEEVLPVNFGQLNEMRKKLENHYKEMQDIEFTIQQGKLYLLQTRNGKRTAEASVRISVEMANEGTITKKEAILRVNPESLNQLLHPTLDPLVKSNCIAKGMPASPGAVSGKIVLNSEDAERRAASGEKVILVRLETSPEDISGMHSAAGILTARGGMTSHAAVVARGMGRACITGANDIRIDEKIDTVYFGDRIVKTGTDITIDGSTGNIFLGIVSTIYPKMSKYFETLMKWADKERRMKIRANAETPSDAKTAISFGAEGIGLCRTEHMFFDEKRISVMRQMILAQNKEDRKLALDKLLPMQRLDFENLFSIMQGLPVTIRLLDPPLHEFLPSNENELKLAALEGKIDIEKARSQLIKLHESNPMLGHRGCRLAVSYPEICEMQAKAILEAAANVYESKKTKVKVEIMVPLAATRDEVEFCKVIINNVAKKLQKSRKIDLSFSVGTMIELPRAAICAGELAKSAEFFSFGTNDLTQTVFGISRDDAGSFLGKYLELGIYKHDPFVSIDINSVGSLVDMGVKKGREKNSNLKVGVCGEHGGDPKSIEYFEKIELDYISASPFRIPIARLAAAHATILNKK